jgi:hypothetical protein
MDSRVGTNTIARDRPALVGRITRRVFDYAGDFIIATTDDGKPYVYQVHVKEVRAQQGRRRAAHHHVPGRAATWRCACPAIWSAGRNTRPPHHPAAKASTGLTDTQMTAATDPNYRHPKCYTNTRGGCSTKISGEHFISHSLIKLYSFDDPDLTIKHDTGYGIREFVKPGKFVANILCEKHDNDLHSADDAALAFAPFMRTISLRYKNGAGEWGDYEEITLSGDDFQAWILKLILNHVVGKAFIRQKGEFVSPFPPEAVDLLLGRAMWPSTWGLCVAGGTSNTDLKINAFDRFEDATTEWCSFQPFIHNDGWIGGGVVNLNGVGFGLTVFNPGRELASFNNPGNPLRGSLQRPAYMAWEINGVQKRVNFTWSDIWEHKTVTYTLTRGD